MRSNQLISKAPGRANFAQRNLIKEIANRDIVTERHILSFLDLENVEYKSFNNGTMIRFVYKGVSYDIHPMSRRDRQAWTRTSSNRWRYGFRHLALDMLSAGAEYIDAEFMENA